MTKKDVLKQSCSAVHEEYEQAHEDILAIFAPVHASFSEENTDLEVFPRHAWSREIGFRISNNDMQWCSESIRFDLKPNKETMEYDLSFSYGSGGWQEGIEAQRQLRYMEDVLRATRLAHNVANSSKISLGCALDKFFEIQETLNSIQHDIRVIEDAEKKEAQDALRKEVIEALPLRKAKSAARYFREMTEDKTDSYEVQTLANVVIDGDNIRLVKTEVVIEKYAKTTIKIDGDRISRKNFEAKSLHGFVEIPANLRYCSAFSYSRNGKTLENIVAELTEEA